ncbi:MAG: MATE family efflux transporter [Lachnospiraceae bacterium]|nr:MATE family efflux transporter [Lachnospiraceae bacterium]
MKYKFFDKEPHFYKNVFTLALPIAAQSLITIGVNMLDNIMVGSLGDNALSATSLANSFIGIYHIFCMGLGMGASVLVSRYYSMKKSGDEPENADRALKQTVCLMLRLALVLATFFALLTAIMPKTIMHMYTGGDVSKALIVEDGIRYLEWSIASYFFTGLSLTSTIALRSVREVKYPLIVSIGAFFVNLGANYTFIYGKFGAPRMEVAGAALGTLIARVFEAGLIMSYLLFIDKEIGFRIRHFFMKTGSLIAEYIRISIPVLISDGILAIGTNAVSMIYGHLEAAFIAANSVTVVTQQLSTVVVQGVCQAGAIVTGQTLGTGDKEKTMKQGYLFFGLGIALGLVSALFITLAKNPIIAFYSGGNGEEGISAEAVAIANQLMLAISFVIIFQATNSIMTKGVLRGGGDTKMLMLTDNIFLWAVSIPLGILAGFVFHFPAFWIYVCLKSDQIIKTFWSLLRLRSGKWIKKISTGKKEA